VCGVVRKVVCSVVCSRFKVGCSERSGEDEGEGIEHPVEVVEVVLGKGFRWRKRG